ncbi:conserved hypothetical protein (plasmid) [Rhodococcus jostii RHA1]|jgi:hypothetical protein|uniref:Uncharacterized protein n=4 Tax=Rhodococcus TaxID=1827 RepID=Q0RZL0_RHOJR|nr:conserved hypothetical protein [Rhodococcus jostii RHA1]
MEVPPRCPPGAAAPRGAPVAGVYMVPIPGRAWAECLCPPLHFVATTGSEEGDLMAIEPGIDELRELNIENEGVIRALRRQRDAAETKLAKIENLVNSSHERVIGQDGTSGVPLEKLLALLDERE